MEPRLVTAPAEEPVTLAEAKAHLRLEHNEDDVYVESLITAARQYVEQICWRRVVTQEWELVLGGFPGADEISLAKEDLKSVESVQYVDANGDEQTLSPDVYAVDAVSEPGRVVLAPGQSWPATAEREDAVRVRFKAGCPRPVAQAILLLVSQMYEHRTPEVHGALAQVHFAVDALLAPYRVVRF